MIIVDGCKYITELQQEVCQGFLYYPWILNWETWTGKPMKIVYLELVEQFTLGNIA